MCDYSVPIAPHRTLFHVVTPHNHHLRHSHHPRHHHWILAISSHPQLTQQHFQFLQTHCLSNQLAQHASGLTMHRCIAYTASYHHSPPPSQLTTQLTQLPTYVNCTGDFSTTFHHGTSATVPDSLCSSPQQHLNQLQPPMQLQLVTTSIIPSHLHAAD